MTTVHERRQQQLDGFEMLGVHDFDVVASHWRLKDGGDPTNEDDWERPDSYWRYMCGKRRVQLAPETRLMHGLSGKNTERKADDDMEAGAEVYIRPARGHDHPAVFLDDARADTVTYVRERWRCMVVETSPGSYHIWIMTDRPLCERERLQVQRYLQKLLKTDLGSVSGEHLGRWAGFQNRKPWRKPNWVNLTHLPEPSAGPLVITPEMLEDEAEEYKPHGRRGTQCAAPVDAPPRGTARSSGNGGDHHAPGEIDTTNSGRVFGVVFRGLYYRDMARDQAIDWIMADEWTRKREGANLRHFADKTVTSAQLAIANGKKPYRRGR
jgi:hypothetical protein